MTEGKSKRRGIGSISQFATLGNAKTPERPSNEEPEIQNALASGGSNTQVTCSLNAIASKQSNDKESKNLSAQGPSTQVTEHSNVEVSENQVAQTAKESDTKMSEDLGVQESKRLIQISEEELKRLMVEALQSQNVKAPEPEKPKRLRQTVYLEPDLHKKVRHRIADTGEDISDVVNLALRQLLENT